MGKMGSNRRFILYFVIAFLSIIVYINALDNGFHYDDEHDIVTNSFLGKWENIPLLFSSAQFYQDKIISTDHYRPVVYVTYAFNKIIGGNNPFGYHVVNLAFHIGSALLVFLIVKAMLGSSEKVANIGNSEQVAGSRKNIAGSRLEDSPATFSATCYPLPATSFIALTAALIFAVHPFNSEVVNYITARSSLMSGFFYLLAFYCWVQYRKVGGSSEQVTGKDSPATCYPLPATLFAFPKPDHLYRCP